MAKRIAYLKKELFKARTVDEALSFVGDGDDFIVSENVKLYHFFTTDTMDRRTAPYAPFTATVISVGPVGTHSFHKSRKEYVITDTAVFDSENG
mgnify:CR=1 FL=1